MESRGVFFAGFTGYYVGTVWIGSDDYKPLISSATGSAYAAKLWKSIMTKLHAGLPNKASCIAWNTKSKILLILR